MNSTEPFPILKAPFPWFGGKSRAAHLVWPRFGDVPNYVEPAAGNHANAKKERIWFSPHCLRPEANPEFKFE